MICVFLHAERGKNRATGIENGSERSNGTVHFGPIQQRKVAHLERLSGFFEIRPKFSESLVEWIAPMDRKCNGSWASIRLELFRHLFRVGILYLATPTIDNSMRNNSRCLYLESFVTFRNVVFRLSCSV